HPVKSRPAIHAAFHQYGATDFALDSTDELEKILQETVRAELVGTAPLLRLARPHAARLGICFHVGSQCPDPSAYGRAMALAAEAAALSGVAIDIVDIGGGFPVSYPDAVPPPLDDYVAAIGDGAARFGDGVRLWAEPGRALVAGGGSVVVQVQLRRGDALYVNDGVYGSLSDAGHPGFRFPARRIPVDGAAQSEVKLGAFVLYGPTCD